MLDLLIKERASLNTVSKYNKTPLDEVLALRESCQKLTTTSATIDNLRSTGEFLENKVLKYEKELEKTQIKMLSSEKEESKELEKEINSINKEGATAEKYMFVYESILENKTRIEEIRQKDIRRVKVCDKVIQLLRDNGARTAQELYTLFKVHKAKKAQKGAEL